MCECGLKQISLKFVDAPSDTFPINDPSLCGSILGGSRYQAFILEGSPVSGIEISKGSDRLIL
jgi:hypothetical protein